MFSSTSALRVLVVEDDYLVGVMIRGILEDLGYQVVGEASSGLEGISLAHSLQPDVILMDIQMPDMDGITTTRRIQAECPTPVIVLTAYETASLVEEASQAGVGAYLVKPPNPLQVQRALTIASARFQDMMALRRLNEQLEARNEDLDTFAHTVAHDLQNPVARMIGFSETLLVAYDELPLNTIRTYLETIVRNGRRMSNIIDELLLLASVRQQTILLTRLDMGTIVREAQERLADMINDTGGELRVPKFWPVALGYAAWVEEVWVNYLSNALRYGGNPPQIELGADPGKQVRFWIKDNGPGIKLEEQEHLFRPFSQFNQVQTEGHGLGLSIVHRIVEKLGGQVGVESEPGQGSCFWFTLPAPAQTAGGEVSGRTVADVPI